MAVTYIHVFAIVNQAEAPNSVILSWAASHILCGCCAGFMHLLPDAVSSTPDAVSIDFPMAYFFAALGFYILFLLQKVVAPLLGGRGHSQEASACGCTGACCAGKLPTHQVRSPPQLVTSMHAWLQSTRHRAL